MGCFPFANYHFQMGVTVMGFVEHFGQKLVIVLNEELFYYNLTWTLANISLETIPTAFE